MTSPEPELDTTAADTAAVDVESTVEPTADPASGSEEATGGNSAEVAELTAALQRERAQFANYKRRTEEEKQGRVAYGKQILIDKLLPVLDDLDRAREHGDLESGPLKGVADKLIATLDAEGLAKFGAPGDPFDPELHEAVQNDGSGTEPVIGAVYRGGYRLGDKVIRTAMVTVTDPDPQTDPSAQPSTTGHSGAQ
ncbi:nucleotide exchange factor GrpE [Gordonia sp. w5E2]|uniref:Protein GrpE n=1 Tax=Gordonia jacobaea TaxID=122202 RepID=A0ABR5I8L9_9ACTN|nr:MULTISPECIES: nucleotide exchange factor GrpE [Gordonia]SKY69538.1 protein GrpE [Mycobacteroides abscessus subsp. abscessus]KNA90001.1 molecular chaperone GrpE [Gordonia jacobaea]OBC06572.1 nucleotide exchange factor GrpE [Gordonia sp. 852002-50395_SCH5434458]OBC11665.1 nucleotide exchange factor GrpE [Gordonia sp. 852002-50816_SCH5313054-a]OBC16754.1 nucleotide exchange factor GrpE [Gordonia sp. 852002-50816_SCH5313054-c]